MMHRLPLHRRRLWKDFKRIKFRNQSNELEFQIESIAILFAATSLQDDERFIYSQLRVFVPTRT